MRNLNQGNYCAMIIDLANMYKGLHGNTDQLTHHLITGVHEAFVLQSPDVVKDFIVDHEPASFRVSGNEGKPVFILWHSESVWEEEIPELLGKTVDLLYGDRAGILSQAVDPNLPEGSPLRNVFDHMIEDNEEDTNIKATALVAYERGILIKFIGHVYVSTAAFIYPNEVADAAS